jgi:pimeloyl-ACP methyl ester carboxylesterase
MVGSPQVLWLNVSSSLQRFDQPLLRYLSKYISVAQWEYYQTQDEACSLETALTLLHNYLQCCNRPVHLVGHGTAGLLGLLYTRKYPQQVKSLSLLSVGFHPAVDWQAHYYVHRQLLSCRREAILGQMVQYLFGHQTQFPVHKLIRILEQDLDQSLSPHTLFKRVSVPSGNVSVPLLVCGGEVDIVVDPNQLQSWRPCLKPDDRLWSCPEGSYFFHFSQPEAVGQQLLNFWLALPAAANSLSLMQPS